MKTKLENLIVVNKEELEKELANLKAIKDNGYIHIGTGLKHDKDYIDIRIYCLEQIISNSKPLKPFVEDAFDDSGEFHIKLYDSTDYLSYDYEIDKYNYLNKEIEW